MKPGAQRETSGRTVHGGRLRVAHEEVLDDPQIEVDAEVAADEPQHRIERVSRGDRVPEDEELRNEAGERRDARQRDHGDADHQGGRGRAVEQSPEVLEAVARGVASSRGSAARASTFMSP